MKIRVAVNYSFREDREEIVTLDLHSEDDITEADVIDALRDAGYEFSEQEELRIDDWSVDE